MTRRPQARPNTTATRISRGAWSSSMASPVSPPVKVMPRMMVKQEMANTSSMLAAAITRLGMP